MGITIGLIMSQLIAYGYDIIHEFDEYTPVYHRLGENIVIGKSHIHGHVALNMYCEQCSIFYAGGIAASILAYANSEFNFTSLKIYLIREGHELGFYEFDGDNVVFRPTTFGTKPDSLLADESYCNKVEEELKMKEPEKIDFKASETFTFETGVFLMSAPIPTIEKIHISGPCTVIIWSDKTKTMVRLQEGEPYDAEKAVYAAIAKKFIGTNKSKSNWLDIIRKKMPDEQHNNAFYGVEKSDVESVKQLLKGIYGAHKDEIEELHKAFEEGYNDKTETNGLTNFEPDVSADDSVSGD